MSSVPLAYRNISSVYPLITYRNICLQYPLPIVLCPHNLAYLIISSVLHSYRNMSSVSLACRKGDMQALDWDIPPNETEKTRGLVYHSRCTIKFKACSTTMHVTGSEHMPRIVHLSPTILYLSEIFLSGT